VHGVFINPAGDFRRNGKSVPRIIQSLWKPMLAGSGGGDAGDRVARRVFHGARCPGGVCHLSITSNHNARLDAG